jgi:hypothetical protein
VGKFAIPTRCSIILIPEQQKGRLYGFIVCLDIKFKRNKINGLIPRESGFFVANRAKLKPQLSNRAYRKEIDRIYGTCGKIKFVLNPVNLVNSVKESAMFDNV